MEFFSRIFVSYIPCPFSGKALCSKVQRTPEGVFGNTTPHIPLSQGHATTKGVTAAEHQTLKLQHRKAASTHTHRGASESCAT